MEKHENFFTPEQVDEQIEQHIGDLQAAPETRFLSEIQQIARQVREGQEPSLRRVEDRLMKHALTGVEHVAAAPSEQRRRSYSPQTIQQGRLNRMEKKQVSKFGRRVSLLIAALVTALLVGSLVAILSLTHQKTATGHGTNATPTLTTASTPTSVKSFGKTLYTTPSNQPGFNSLSWSPDSKRVASSSVDGVQIWDATTGKHMVNVHLPGANEWSYGLSWSPNSQLVAIGTNQHLLVVNGQTGAIVHTYTTALASVNTSGGGSSLSARIPASGGYGFLWPRWSPDGKLIAVAVSSASANEEILAWNPQTNAIAFKITATAQEGLSLGDWSPDGQYLAGMISIQSGSASESGPLPVSYVAVWKVSTRQIVFKEKDNSNSEPIWQPHSDNLAFVQLNIQYASPAETLPSSMLEIWNIPTYTQIKRYPLEAWGPIVWSPDGKYLAYASYSSLVVPTPAASTPTNTPTPAPTPGITGAYTTPSWVSIIDASSGQLVYTYKGHKQNLSELAWSPNGKYIVSGEGNGGAGNLVAKVWTAE